MDEISLVRQLLDEPPPSPDVVAEGRTRLLSRAGITYDVGAPVGAVATGSRTTRRVVRRVLALSFASATVAAAALVVAMLTPDGASPGQQGNRGNDASTRKVSHSAVAPADSQPTGGPYWHVRCMETFTVPRRYGTNADSYELESTDVIESWQVRDGQAWTAWRDWARPKTPADEAAWRRNGAPTEWPCAVGQKVCFHTPPGKTGIQKQERFPTVPKPFRVDDALELYMTFDELQQLPTDPATLRTLLLDHIRGKENGVQGYADQDANGHVDYVLLNLIENLPVPPDVRAAAYRALTADTGNVTSTGPQQDELGRSGVGLHISTEIDGIADVIIDPQTPKVLQLTWTTAAPHTTRLPQTTVYLEQGWTNDGPHLPAMP